MAAQRRLGRHGKGWRTRPNYLHGKPRTSRDCPSPVRLRRAMAGEQLRVIEGSEQDKRLSVDADLLIGRTAPEDEGRLGGDPEISRVHARISRGGDGQLMVEDLGSANGTFVNRERLDAPRTL